MILLLFFLISSVPAQSLLIGDDFLVEFSRRIPSDDSERLNQLLRSKTFRSLREPGRRRIMQEFESHSVLDSWAKHHRELRILLHTDVLSRAEERRYFYLRESFREAGRSTMSKEVGLAFKRLIKSDFLPLLANPLFRSYLSPLIENGHLSSLFSIAGDYAFFRNNPAIWNQWSQSLDIPPSQEKEFEHAVPTLIRLVKDQPDVVRVRARRIRDSGYFQKETLKLRENELYLVFLGMVLRPSIGEDIQTTMDENLLIPAIKRAHIDWEANLVRTIQAMPEYENMDLSSFLLSPGFRVFANSRFASHLLEFQKTGILKDLPNIAGNWSILLEPRLKQDYEKVQSFMEAIERERRKESARLRESTMKRSGCFKNMDILMGKREEYNLRYREEIDLQNQSKRSRFWNIVGKKDLLCPDSGEYHSTEFGWVYCTIHGKARIISHE